MSQIRCGAQPPVSGMTETIFGQDADTKSAPAGAATPHDRGLADRKDTDRLMAIMPDAADPSSTCTLAHVDGCEECITNTEPPEHREATAHGCLCFYKCHDCGHVWETAWGCA